MVNRPGGWAGLSEGQQVEEYLKHISMDQSMIHEENTCKNRFH